MFVVNGINVRVYKLADDADMHDFRNRYADKDSDFEPYATVKGQPVWYSSEKIRFYEELYDFRSIGYFIFNSNALQVAGLSPAPDGNNWDYYRLLPEINGTYSDNWLRVVEVRQESPLRGSFGLWYVHFDEVRDEPVAPTTEQIAEERDTRDLEDVTETIRVYD